MKRRHQIKSKRKCSQIIRTSIRSSNDFQKNNQKSSNASNFDLTIAKSSSQPQRKKSTIVPETYTNSTSAIRLNPQSQCSSKSDQSHHKDSQQESKAKYRRKKGACPCCPCSCLQATLLVFLGLLLAASIAALLIATLMKSTTVQTTSTTSTTATTATSSTTSSTSTTTTTITSTTTTTTVTVLVMQTNDTVVGLWKTTATANGTLATPGWGVGNYVASESPINAFDGTCLTKYTSFGPCIFLPSASGTACGLNTGFHVTPRQGPTVVKTLRFCAGNDVPARDPLTMTLEGSNQTGSALFSGSSWTLIYTGSTGLDVDPGRYNYGVLMTLSSNTNAYTSYRILLTSTRGTDFALQYSEVEMLGLE